MTPRCRAQPTYTRTQELRYDVFLSHAGEQKHAFVDLVYEHLRLVRQASGSDFQVFMDDSSLRGGHQAWPKIVKAANQCRIGML